MYRFIIFIIDIYYDNKRNKKSSLVIESLLRIRYFVKYLSRVILFN